MLNLEKEYGNNEQKLIVYPAIRGFLEDNGFDIEPRLFFKGYTARRNGVEMKANSSGIEIDGDGYSTKFKKMTAKDFYKFIKRFSLKD